MQRKYNDLEENLKRTKVALDKVSGRKGFYCL